MKRLLLPLLVALALPTAGQAEISDEIHKRCLDARDYSGCVRTNQSSSLNLKKEITGIGVNLFLNTETSEITIQSIINGTPASNADIESGDVILEVDGMSMKGLGIEEAINFTGLSFGPLINSIASSIPIPFIDFPYTARIMSPDSISALEAGVPINN